jgi:hypothetical protein
VVVDNSIKGNTGPTGPSGGTVPIAGATKVEFSTAPVQAEFPGASQTSNVTEIVSETLTEAPKGAILTVESEGFLAVGIVSKFLETGKGRIKFRLKTVEGNEPVAGTKFKVNWILWT